LLNYRVVIQTYGLTNIALKVKDLDRSVAFYHQLFDARVMYKEDHFVQIQTPGSKDIIVFEKADEIPVNQSGIIHFGFRLMEPVDADKLVAEVIKAGGRIKEQGEFVPGEPYVFFFDPDGYEAEVWYEKIPLDLDQFL